MPQCTPTQHNNKKLIYIYICIYKFKKNEDMVEKLKNKCNIFLCMVLGFELKSLVLATGALPLEPRPQSFMFYVFFR
jgi:hypothetical protein